MCEGHFKQSGSAQGYLEHKKLESLMSTITNSMEAFTYSEVETAEDDGHSRCVRVMSYV